MSEDKNNKIEIENKPFTLLDVILIFLKYKKKIFIISGIVCLISIILYFFVFDMIYYSGATIKSDARLSIGLGGFEGIPEIGALADFTGGSTKDLSLYENILMSRRCLEPLIIKFDLLHRDEYQYVEDAIKDFQKSKMKIDVDKIAGVLTIGIYDKDKQLAKEMVDFLLLQLDKINVELNVQSAKNNREFIEKRYNQAREDLFKAEDTLKSFQIVYGVSPDLQVKASAQTEFSLEGELKAEEVKLDVLKKILSPDQVEVKTQEAKINSLKEQIAKIQTSTDLNDFLRLGNSPQIVMSFLRLQREVEIQSKIVSFLLPVYEQAKIEEKKETPTISILDKPYIAERKSKPKRLTMVIVSTFSSFLFLSLFFIVYDTQIKYTLSKIRLKKQ